MDGEPIQPWDTVERVVYDDGREPCWRLVKRGKPGDGFHVSHIFPRIVLEARLRHDMMVSATSLKIISRAR